MLTVLLLYLLVILYLVQWTIVGIVYYAYANQIMLDKGVRPALSPVGYAIVVLMSGPLVITMWVFMIITKLSVALLLTLFYRGNRSYRSNIWGLSGGIELR